LTDKTAEIRVPANSGSSGRAFFRSRWVSPAEGVRELDPDELPAGFRAAGVACGIKANGRLDVGLIVCDEDEAVSAARFTRNALVAAPVTVSRAAECRRLRGVAVNSGVANVSDGERGLSIAKAMAKTAADGIGIVPARMGVASTGVIGQGLDREKVLAGISEALAELGPNAQNFAQAIMTTDRAPKYASLELSLSGGPVRLSAQAKGAGMISPSFATMLCFIESDAALDRTTLERLLDAALERSFERISVDGQLSTNDSVFMIASGSSGVAVEPGTDDERTFAEALDALLLQLAVEVVADGEGATRVARLEVRGSAGATEPVARAVGNSLLVKTALFGGDPNWGRILSAAGQVLPDLPGVELDLSIEGIDVARRSVAVEQDDGARGRLDAAMASAEVEMTLAFADESERSEIFFSDLGHEYVRINAEYS
jgi:glutamate N-acetyltransferase/amino-acid N-acetyltransferase